MGHSFVAVIREVKGFKALRANRFLVLSFLSWALGASLGFSGKPVSGVEDESLGVISSLYIPPAAAQTQRREFLERLQASRPPRKQLLEQYLPLIGANGILDGLETLWPKCHSEAHELGRMIFAQIRDIGRSLAVCAHRCYSGCMHGVVMEALADTRLTDGGPLAVGAIAPLMKSLCRADPTMIESYSPGDCAHGVGHALMFLSGADIPPALKACTGFAEDSLAYYCATGVYMEYVTTHDAQDATTRSLLYPCDVYEYPAACARYKMVHVARRHYEAKQPTEGLRQRCAVLSGSVRGGCFHGLGNAHAPWVAAGEITLEAVCHGWGRVRNPFALTARWNVWRNMMSLAHDISALN